jgi:membrane protein
MILSFLRRVRDAVPGLRVAVQAVQNYIRHQSANQAGSVAFSTLLSMFPLLLFVSAAAAYIGEPGAVAEMTARVLEVAPSAVAGALDPVIDQVLAQRNHALLAVGVVVTLWTASSGTQAIRTALNRAYGVRHGMSFWGARLKVTLFTVLSVLATVLVFSSVVILPHAWRLIHSVARDSEEALWLHDGVRYGIALVVLVFWYALFYGWLPDVRQRLRTVLPGAIVGAVLWLCAAAVLSYVLRSLGKLALVYGGFAGIVATLIFLYASAVTLIFGAEVNGVLMNGAAPREDDEADDMQP